MTGPTDLDARETPAERLIDHRMPDVITCPDPTCRAPAGIVDRWTWASSDGPVEHIKCGCKRSHWFTPPVDSLDLQSTLTAPGAVDPMLLTQVQP